MKKKILVGLSTLIIAFGAVEIANADLITNGGFETIATKGVPFPGWTTSGNFDVNTFEGVPSGIYTVHSGSQAAFLGPVGSDAGLSQTLSTNIGQRYEVSFWLASDGLAPNDFSATWGGASLLGLIDIPTQNYTQYKFQVLANATSETLQFSFMNTPGFLSLDDVSVNPVPEPATMLLFGTGIAGLVAARRKKKA